jgi:hypothetical protein
MVGFLWTNNQPVESSLSTQDNTETQRKTPMPGEVFECTIPATKRPRHTPYRAASGPAFKVQRQN